MTTSPLLTTDTELSGLWATHHGKRASSTTVKVPADALEHLLKDHHTLLTALRDRKLLTITIGPDMESLKP
ncbi:hypothetical protein SAMN02745126_04022 [Enhydrobacter aerosaccus]|uniref:Uncharacterized protein n=1 Tax=Enhydrobacter aerosaccus TaxID=225324 RepID=A0A1T4RQR3_9HYPH|nr:hypothetical protein SAMN02745126_04022 [Enhydrobacter aerosaccus]